MTDRCTTTKERAMEYIAVCWDGATSETVTHPTRSGAMAVIRADTGVGVVDVVRARGRDVNEAWANAMDKARKVADAQANVAAYEVARHEADAARARLKHRRIIDVLNGVDRSGG